ncbi:hypothetical protein FEM48_Zijuj05G0175800 [Ziziphus jujuba var. spinosa]|uniref:Uncharacterized protein n=1 Tax=Ziziphus jujuba var. spinosa TaxID=714518 RepID=A0A978VG69_ZIZJJ|nr:hypothetical protein FEM48_Zijuj05G0175800 [Ziziphus jujuba var. spinosa]
MFPNIVEKTEFITSLDLSGTTIKQLPCSIDHIVALRELCLSACKKLVHIPSTIYKLAFLDVLVLNGFSNFSMVPNYVQEIHGAFELRRTFDDFANGGMQFSWSSRQKRERVSASTNIFETEYLEEEEELDDHQNRGHGRRTG